MTSQVSQPPCGFFGSLVHADKITEISRDITPYLAEAEQHIARMADDQDLAMRAILAQSLESHSLCESGVIDAGEYAIRVAGDCLGDAVTEGDLLVMNPAAPIVSGGLCMFKALGVEMMRAKIYLGRMESVGSAADIFCEKPAGVFVFWNHHPAHIMCCAGQDLLAADAVLARIDGETGKRTDIPDPMLTADDRASLEGTLAFLDRSPLVLNGENAFEVDCRAT